MSEEETGGTEAAIVKRFRLEYDRATTNLEASLVTRWEFDGPVKLADVAPSYLLEPKTSSNAQSELKPLLRRQLCSLAAEYKGTPHAESVVSAPAKQPAAVARRCPTVLAGVQDSLPPETLKAASLATITRPSGNCPVPVTGPRSLSLAYHRRSLPRKTVLDVVQ